MKKNEKWTRKKNWRKFKQKKFSFKAPKNVYTLLKPQQCGSLENEKLWTSIRQERRQWQFERMLCAIKYIQWKHSTGKFYGFILFNVRIFSKCFVFLNVCVFFYFLFQTTLKYVKQSEFEFGRLASLSIKSKHIFFLVVDVISFFFLSFTVRETSHTFWWKCFLFYRKEKKIVSLK